MSFLGSFQSEGVIFLENEQLGPGEICLDVYKEQVLIDALGTLVANGKVFLKIKELRGRAWFQTSEGVRIDFVLTSYDLSKGRAEIAISGAVPGF